jgi:UPF0716 protein FxsA
MVTRLFLLYVLTELAVVVGLSSTIGFAPTMLVLAGTFMAGVVLAGAQARRQLARLRSEPTTSRGAVTDDALVALGSALVLVPGLATTAAGLLLLLPPTRAAARPLLTALALRGLGQRTGRGAAVVDDGVIDGEVVDVGEVEPSRRTL